MSNDPGSIKPRRAPLALKLIRCGFRFGGRMAPALAGRIAYKLWFTPPHNQTPASEMKVLKSAKVDFLQINNQTIATYSWGQTGATVLLVHGWGGRGTQLGYFVKPLLDAGFRVFSFDAPAHGKSSGKQTNLYEVAGTLLALQLHLGSIDAVITHSFGGPCIAMAVQRGFKTKRIVSISTPATILNLVEKFRTTLDIPEKSGKILMRLIETSFGKNIWEDISMINMTKAINIPGVLIHDSNDLEIPWQDSHAIAQVWNNSSFIKTSGLGHRRIVRDANVIKAAVSFIKNGR